MTGEQTCQTGKIEYSSRSDAQEAIKWLQAHLGAKYKEQHPYLCHVCKRWHLSSNGNFQVDRPMSKGEWIALRSERGQ